MSLQGFPESLCLSGNCVFLSKEFQWLRCKIRRPMWRSWFPKKLHLSYETWLSPWRFQPTQCLVPGELMFIAMFKWSVSLRGPGAGPSRFYLIPFVRGWVASTSYGEGRLRSVTRRTAGRARPGACRHGGTGSPSGTSHDTSSGASTCRRALDRPRCSRRAWGHRGGGSKGT